MQRFDEFNRPDAPYHYTVAAVSTEGVTSEMADAASAIRIGGKRVRDTLEKTKLAKTPKKGKDAVRQPPAPTGLRARYDAEADAVELTWDAPPDATVAGYRVYRSSDPPETHRGYGLILAGGKAKTKERKIRKGDLVIVAKTFLSFSRKQLVASRVWGAGANRTGMPPHMPDFPDENPDLTWSLEPHEPDSPVVEGGRTCAKFTLGAGGKVAFKEYKYGPTSQSYYRVFQPGETYVVEFWAKQEGMATPKVTFSLGVFYGSRMKPLEFEIGREWKRHRATFTIQELYEGTYPGQIALSFGGPGTLWIDNYRVYSPDVAFMDYSPLEYANLKASGMKALRTHAFIKSGSNTYSMEQLVDVAGTTTGILGGNTLPQTLAIMRKAGVLPWLQIEYHMSPQEWLGLVEYLAAPYDPAKDSPKTKPWAYRRYRQGQAKPWADEFPSLWLEFGNETWNWLFKPWVFEGMTDAATGKFWDRGAVYGLFQEHVIDCLKASPYWTPALDAKVSFVLGGWMHDNYSFPAAKASPRSACVSYAAYNGGWDEGEGPAAGNDSSLFMAMIHPGQRATPVAEGFRRNRDKLRAEGLADIALGTYEAGPGYALSGLNGQAKMSRAEVRAQEESMKSLGVGTATLDTFLLRAANDFDLQNFFLFRHGGNYWTSHRSQRIGGEAYPCWMTLELFNNHGTGDMLRVDTQSVPTVDMPAYKRRKARPDLPLVACYATRRGDRLNLFVLSRKIDNYPIAGDDGFTPVTVDLPIRLAKSVTLHRMVGDPRAHNLDEVKVKIESGRLPASVASPRFTVDARTGVDARGLPPGATLLYVFEGVQWDAENGKGNKENES